MRKYILSGGYNYIYLTLVLYSKELNLPTGKKFTLIGTPQGREHKDPSGELSSQPPEHSHIPLEMDLPDIVNDLDIDFASDPEAAAKVQNDQRNLRKIREVVASTTVNVMNPLRVGKSLLVLDLDYSTHHLNVPVHNSPLFSYPRHQATHLGDTPSFDVCSPASS